MAKARKDNKGRVLQKGESQRSQDNRYVYTYTNPNGTRSYIYATTLQELREKEKKLLRDQLDGLDLYVGGKADLNYVVDRYMATKNNLATSTYANYRYMYDRFCKDGFGKRKATEIKYSDMLHFYLQLVENGILLGTGCRIGEVCGLRWQDIDFETRVIDINHSMTYFRRGTEAPYTFEFKFEPPKTKAGIRKIPMLDEVYKVLKELYEEQKEKGFSLLEVDGATGFIFINKLGTLYKHSSIDHAIKRIVNTHNAEEEVKAKKEKRDPVMLPFFSCHTFRHTFCTRFCEHETNVKVIQAIMGHADIQTTMDIVVR